MWCNVHFAGLYQMAGHICHSFSIMFFTTLPLCSTSENRADSILPLLTNMKFKWFQLQCASSVMDCTNNWHFVDVDWKASSLSGEFWTPARFSACHLHNLYSGIFGITVWALEEMCMIMDRNCIEPEKLVASFLFLELAHTKIHQPISLEDHRLNLIRLI